MTRTILVLCALLIFQFSQVQAHVCEFEEGAKFPFRGKPGVQGVGKCTCTPVRHNGVARCIAATFNTCKRGHSAVCIAGKAAEGREVSPRLKCGCECQNVLKSQTSLSFNGYDIGSLCLAHALSVGQGAYTFTIEVTDEAAEAVQIQKLDTLISKGFTNAGVVSHNTAWIVRNDEATFPGRITYTWTPLNVAAFTRKTEENAVISDFISPDSDTFGGGEEVAFTSTGWTTPTTPGGSLQPPFIRVGYEPDNRYGYLVLKSVYEENGVARTSPYYYDDAPMAASEVMGYPVLTLQVMLARGVSVGTFIGTTSGDKIIVDFGITTSQTICMFTNPNKLKPVFKPGPC